MVITPANFRHDLLVLLMVCIGANLDNLGVGIAYGLAKNSIPSSANLVIALLSGGLTYLAMVFGSFVGLFLPTQIANDVGAVILIAVGIWVGWEALIARVARQLYRRLKRSILAWRSTAWVRIKSIQRVTVSSPAPHLKNQQCDPFERLSLKETLILGISLALNAMAGGFGASLAGFNAIAISIGVGVFSYLTIALGQELSTSLLSKWLGTVSQKLAGLLLMAIGVYELWRG